MTYHHQRGKTQLSNINSTWCSWSKKCLSFISTRKYSLTTLKTMILTNSYTQCIKLEQSKGNNKIRESILMCVVPISPLLCCFHSMGTTPGWLHISRTSFCGSCSIWARARTLPTGTCSMEVTYTSHFRFRTSSCF